MKNHAANVNGMDREGLKTPASLEAFLKQFWSDKLAKVKAAAEEAVRN